MMVHPLKHYRDARGLTQEALAARLGVTSITVSRWETGARKIDRRQLPRVVKETVISAIELRPDIAELMKISG